MEKPKPVVKKPTKEIAVKPEHKINVRKSIPQKPHARTDPKFKVIVLEKLERQMKVRELSATGMSANKIAPLVGVSHPQVLMDLRTLYRDATETADADIKEKRELMVMRLEEIYDECRELYLKSGDMAAAKRCLEALAQQAKLEGLNLPEKIALTDPSGDKDAPTTIIQVDARVQAMLARARARQITA